MARAPQQSKADAARKSPTKLQTCQHQMNPELSQKCQRHQNNSTPRDQHELNPNVSAHGKFPALPKILTKKMCVAL
jgi:hypothetical protein